MASDNILLDNFFERAGKHLRLRSNELLLLCSSVDRAIRFARHNATAKAVLASHRAIERRSLDWDSLSREDLSAVKEVVKSLKRHHEMASRIAEAEHVVCRAMGWRSANKFRRFLNEMPADHADLITETTSCQVMVSNTGVGWTNSDSMNGAYTDKCENFYLSIRCDDLVNQDEAIKLAFDGFEFLLRSNTNHLWQRFVRQDFWATIRSTFRCEADVRVEREIESCWLCQSPCPLMVLSVYQQMYPKREILGSARCEQVDVAELEERVELERKLGIITPEEDEWLEGLFTAEQTL